MKALPKERIKQFLTRRKWQKTGKALLAINRLTLLSQNQDRRASETQDEEDSCCSAEEDQACGSLPQRDLSSSEPPTGEEDNGSMEAAGKA